MKPKMPLWPLFAVYLAALFLGAAADAFARLHVASLPLMTGAALAIGVAFFGIGTHKRRMKEFVKDAAAVSPVLGVILMVAITVVLAGVVFIAVSRLSQTHQQATPQLNFEPKGASSYLLVSAPTGLPWSDFTVSGCSQIPTTGNVTAGQTLNQCSGTVSVTYKPTNSISWING